MMFTLLKARTLRDRHTEFVDLKHYVPLIQDLQADTTIPKEATNLVFMAVADSKRYIDSNIIYSIFKKRPKRADVYWFLHIDTVDSPYTSKYSVDTVIPRKCFFVRIKLGFKADHRVNLLFAKILHDMAENAEIDLVSHYDSLRKHSMPSDFKFIILHSLASVDSEISSFDNLIIQGDNLKALKALLPTYSGKVKCIYIDPPYNTGNENWVYNDNVNSPMIKDWLGKVVDKEDLTRHDKWLCMMMPRLKLLRELLSEDGAIFISIDDNEQHYLRCLLDEVFGVDNFVANIMWQKRTSPDNRVVLGAGHEFVVCYSKKFLEFYDTLKKLTLTDEQKSQFKNPDDDPLGPWVSSDFTAQGYRPNQMYEITTPKGKKYSPPEGKCWKNIESVYKKLVKEGRIWFGSDNKGMPRRKTYLNEREGRVPWTWWTNKEAGHNQKAKKEIIEILGSITAFDTPKPVGLIKRVLEIATEPDSIVLDSFSGSGTTAHAVLELNKEDGGNRKFILVEMEEYADKITAERVRRVIKGVKTSKDENLKKGLGGSFSYFELGDPIEMESLLRGKKLPSFKEFARYLFYTATGVEFDEKAVHEKTGFIGESRSYEVYLFYKPELEWLKSNALTLEKLKELPKHNGKKRLVFAPTKYVDDHTLSEFRVDFCQLPYEIYRIQK